MRVSGFFNRKGEIQMNNHQSKETVVDPSFISLYKSGSLASFIAASTILGEVIFLAFFPQPVKVDEWFALMQDNPLIGILDYWGLEILMYVMLIILFLALFTVLRKTNPSLSLIAVTMSLLGIGIFFATNNPFTILSLSNQYAGTTDETLRAGLLAAGEAVLAGTGQRAVNGFNMGLFLVSIGGLLFSLTMRKCPVFAGKVAWIGIAAYILSLADFVRQTMTTSPVITLLLVIPNALLLITWFILAGRKLGSLAKST